MKTLTKTNKGEPKMKMLTKGIAAVAAVALALPTLAESALFAPLPDGYQELEYVEGDGNQYVDTGFRPYSWDVIRVKSRPLQTDMQFFCARGNGSANYYELLMLSDCHMRADSNGGTKTSTGTLEVGQDYDILANYKGGTVTVNGETFIGGISAGNNDLRNSTLYLFALHQQGAGTGLTAVSKSRFYSLSLWDYEGKTLKLKLVPCRETATGAIGVYDVVGKSFIGSTVKPGVSGEHPLKAGPVVSPHVVKTVAWVETTGQQYVDTGLVPETTDTVYMRGIVKDSSNGAFFCARTSSTAFDAFLSNGKLAMDRNGRSRATSTDDVPTDDVARSFVFDFNGGKGTIDGVTYISDPGAITKTATGQTLCFFVFHDTWGKTVYKDYSKIRLYAASIKGSDGTLKRAYSPAQDTVTGEYGLFDDVTKTFVPFVGFVPPTASAAEMVRYQELEYVESDGTQSLDTGCQPYADDTVWLKARALQYDTTYFCARGGSGGGYFEVILLKDPGYVRFDTGSSTRSSENYGGKTQLPNTDYEMSCDFRWGILTVDGVEWMNVDNMEHVQRKSRLWLFALLDAGNTANKVSSRQKVRYYALKVLNAQGELQLDLVPCRDWLTDDIGFYDRVGRKFIGPAEGRLIAGATVESGVDPLVVDVDAGGQTADLTFASATSARKLYWVFGNADQGMTTNGWGSVVEAATVEPGATSLSDVNLPSGFGSSYRVLRAVMGNLYSSDPVYADVAFTATVNRAFSSANLVFAGADTPRELYVVWGKDVGELLESWTNSKKIADVPAGSTGLTVDLSSLSETLEKNKGFRFILKGTPNGATEYIKSHRGFFIVVR